jgi:hypothetical protein
MPNILIVGFGVLSVETHQKICNRLTIIGCVSEAITTVIDAHTFECNDRDCLRPYSRPYIVVRDTIESRGVIIANDLNTTLDLDVELEIIKRFFEGKHPPEE